MQHHRRFALISATLASQIPLALEMARRFAGSGWRCRVLTETPELAARAQAYAREPAVEVAGPYWASGEPGRQLSRGFRRTRRLRRFSRQCGLSELPHGLFTNFDIALNAAALRLQQARAYLRRERPAALIVFEDNLSTDRHLLTAAQRLGIPVIDCPYEISGSEDFERDIAEKVARGEAILAAGDPCGAAVARQYPKWIRDTRHGPILPLPGFLILALEEVGIALRTPWSVHCGSADLLAAESEPMRELYVAEGCPRERVGVLGSVYADVLAETIAADPRLARASAERAPIVPGRMSVLIAMPPSYHATRAAACEFPSYRDFLRELAGGLTALDDVDVTASIHPNTLPDDADAYRLLFRNISSDWVIREIARHDVFLTCFSSTIRWAVRACRPVVNYDLYGFGVRLWDGCPGVARTGRLAEAMDEISKLRDPRHYRARSTLQAGSAEHWSLLDGHGFDRLLAAVAQPRS